MLYSNAIFLGYIVMPNSNAISYAISNALVMFKMNQIPTWVKLVSSPNNRKIDLKVVEIEYQNLYPTRNMNANTCW